MCVNVREVVSQLYKKGRVVMPAEPGYTFEVEELDDCEFGVTREGADSIHWFRMHGTEEEVIRELAKASYVLTIVA